MSDEAPPPEAQVVESLPAVIVPAEFVVKRKRKEKTFSPVIVGDRVAQMSEREAKFLKALIKTGSVPMAAEEIGISLRSGFRYASRPAVKAYIEKMRLRAAKAADLTLDKITEKINDAVDGVEMKPSQLQGIALAAKFLAPQSGPRVVVNQQNNFAAGPTPYSSMGKDEMLAQMRRNLDEMSDSE